MLNIPFSEPFFTLNHVGDDENLFVYRNAEERQEEVPAMLLTKSELMELLKNGDLAREDIEVFFADEDAANFDMDDIAIWMERIRDEQDQYEEWDESMMYDIEKSEEAKAFLRKLNELAQKNPSYSLGAEIMIDRGVSDE